jgi:hypothetical protein
MKTKNKALFAVALLMSVAAQAFPVVVARPVIVPHVSTPHVSVAPHVTPAAHMTPATHVAAVPHINQASAEPRVPTARPSAAERHATHVTPALPVINVPAPLRKRCADQASRECQQ